MTFCVSICHFYHVEHFVGLLLRCGFCLVTTGVFSEVVRPCSVVCGAGGAVGTLVLDEVERAVIVSSTVVEVEDSASEPLSVVTFSVVEQVLDVDTSELVVSSSANPGPSVGLVWLCWFGVEALDPRVK